MAKKKPEIELYSYGIYTAWDALSKEIPRLLEMTSKIPIKDGIEFGYVLKIKKAKGAKIYLEIHHPPIKDKNGDLMPVFKAELYVSSNDFIYFQGDSVWEPLGEKAGIWTLITFMDKKEIARKKFELFIENKQTI